MGVIMRAERIVSDAPNSVVKPTSCEKELPLVTPVFPSGKLQ